MKTIAVCSTPEEAHLVRGRLEAAGIPGFIRDEATIQMNWFYSNAIGGVRVEVMEEDEAAAREFLGAKAPAAQESPVEVTCPACGSARTVHQDLSRRWALVVLYLFKVPIPFSRRSWKCADCRHVFKVLPEAVESQAA